MSSNNWEQIEEHFHAALNLEIKERNEYLTLCCAGDDSLRREVESLLESINIQDEFFEYPAFETGIGLMGKNLDISLTGKTIGSYLIGKRLGSGGMGEVYLAEDTRLNRKVALKFLSPAFVDDIWAKRQLVKEARASAMLDHPNICPVYGFEEIESFNFIVMQYVEGQTLAEIISSRSVNQLDIFPILKQILEALASAHAHGIIHRDIKPNNIMVTPSWQVKVLDFGLAKLIQQKQSTNFNEPLSQASQKGLIAGTVAYMSPEQLRGEKLDFRSDIFSLGILFFELITGERPFARNSDAEVISTILNESPPTLKTSNRQLANIENLIHKCLEKNKEDRYQSVSDILVDLQNPVWVKQKTKLFTLNQRVIWAFTLLFLLIVGVTGYRYFQKPKVHNLAVLPIINESSDPSLDYLSDGLTESLVSRISESSKLPIMPYTTISGFKNDKLDYLDTGRKLGVDAIFTGKLIKRNDELFLQSSLINIVDNSNIWSEEVIFNLSDTLYAQEQLTQKIISSLNTIEQNSSEKPAVNIQTSSPEAFRYYMLGRYYWRNRNKDNIKKAIDAFSNAIKLDPLYTNAYAGLANAYVVQTGPSYGAVSTDEAIPKAKAAAREALLLDINSAESHAAMAVVLGKYEYNWQEAEIEFKKAIELDPAYAQARYWYSEYLSTMGRTEEAFREAQKAKDLDPFSPYMYTNVGRVLYFGRRYDEALKFYSQMAQKEPNNLKVKYFLGLIYLQKKMYPEALQVFEQLYASNEKELTAAVLGYTYAKLGRKNEAHRLLAQMNDMSQDNPLPPQEKAIVLIGLGEKTEAIKWLDKAYEQHLSTLSSLKVEPLYDDLRTSPQFTNILQRMNLDY